MKRQLALTTFAILLTIGMISTATADEETDVTVEVDEEVQLDVKPDNLDFTASGPEEESELSPGEQREISDEGFEHIDINNIGSQRLDNIYAEAETPAEQPFGTDGDTVLHNTGNFIALSLETVNTETFRDGLETGVSGQEDFHLLNRVEFFEDNPPEYIQTQEGAGDLGDDQGDGESGGINVDPEHTHVGRIRVGELNYFFVVYEEETTELENPDQVVVAIANTPEAPSEIGTYDFTEDGDDFSVFEASSSSSDIAIIDQSQEFVNPVGVDTEDVAGETLREGDEAVDTSSLTGESSDYEVRSYNLYNDFNGNGAMHRTRFNVDVESPSGSSYGTNTDQAQEYILDSNGNQDEALQPGENFPVDFAVQVPNGVDAEAVDPGTVTLNAEAFQ